MAKQIFDRDRVLNWFSQPDNYWQTKNIIEQAEDRSREWGWGWYEKKIYKAIYNMLAPSANTTGSFQRPTASGTLKDTLLGISKEDLLKEVEKYQYKKIKKQKEEKKKRDKELEIIGENFKKDMSIGNVYLIKYNNDAFKSRGIIILDIDKDFFIGRYLDRVVKEIRNTNEENSNMIYAAPYWGGIKYEWDGISYRKTMATGVRRFKDIIGKAENIKIENKI